MDKDALLRQLQSWTNSIPLIVLGSGASVPFKLTSMWTLGEHIKNTVKFTNAKDKAQFEKFKLIFAKNGITETLAIAPFLEFKINPKNQFRIGVPIKKYEGLKKEVSFGPFIQWTLQIAKID